MLLNTQHVQKSTKISARSLLSHSFKGKNNNSIKKQRASDDADDRKRL
jgi:hypothetical protein